MTGFEEFIRRVRENLSKPLPGLASQLKMASMRRLIRDGKMIAPDNARRAGVLILFYPLNRTIGLVFIKRNEYPGVHSGQISFPGGAYESGDVDIIATAVREAEEETGIPGKSVGIIGTLTDLFIPPSNFLVTPVVGYLIERPVFHPDPKEVEQLLEFPIDQFMENNLRQEKEISIFPGTLIKAPCFYIDGYVIWGATAMMLSEFIDIMAQES